MKCREIIEILETLAPKSCACDWDNPGLLAGRIDKDVKKILLTLDADDAAVERAKPPIVITHAPGHMFITDLKNTELDGYLEKKRR